MAIDVAQKAGLVTRLSDGHKHSFVRLMSPNGRTVTSPISSPAITSTVTESTSTEAAIPPIDVYLSRLTSGGLAEPQLSESRALVQFLHKRWIETGKRQVFPYKSHRLRHLVSLFPGGSLRKMCPTVVALGIVTIAAPGAARWVQLNHIYHI
ncbi:hypothetical protein BKA62DRAFT_703319 [Auriculariales sp. MPI-PUGE-AT-0066]|nr:hypothetical protein BKA62DRAFT_703319 [Auriculariales sp. MPI-PUGE-AT-0066]